ncbi:GntR family transcriptional regulator [uncultured Ferrovibrio sp.]|jgi:GntR family carbon starvation induced transcriptional regulator|uniref:GntR family transcriptional regulator n=1 Tax=uncultured Ferrovibrio sp. TaxID=1576913 RepID=UPI00260D9DEA|nr:GntR family transcriptional regulator [uncultured Ferrovibrio sp.]
MSSTATPPFGEDAKTLASWVYDRLRDDIVAGSLAPGQKLTLDSLKERYTVGVTPLREALYRLSSSLLVEAEDQRGFRVAPVTVAHLQDIISSREHIETLVLRDAFRHGGEDWKAAIFAAFKLLERTPMYEMDNGPISRAWETAHRRFHQAVLSAARSKALLHFQTMLWDHAARYRNIVAPALLDEAELQAEHAELTRTIEQGDVEMACLLLRRHITNAAAPVLEALIRQKGQKGKSSGMSFERI